MPPATGRTARAVRTGVLITAASVFFSIAPVWLWLQIDPVINTAHIYISTIVLPLLIAPSCSYVILRQQLRAERLAHENHRLANVDELTALPNRRAFFAEAARLQQAATAGSVFVCAIADVDDFKRINDTHGHEQGDAVLVQVARALEQARSGDMVVARLGGEEFAVAGLFAGERAAREACTALVRAVAAVPLLREPVTISLGYAMDAGRDSISGLLSRADQALYLAKQSGKNCVQACRANLQLSLEEA